MGVRRRRRVASALALSACSLAVLLVAAGCSLLVDTSDLDVESSSSSSSSSAGGQGEGGPPNGGGSDGSTSDGPIGTTTNEICKNTVHCETFEEGDPLSRMSADTDDVTKITIDSTKSLSPTHAARFEIEPSNNGSPDATLQFRTKNIANFVFEGSIFIEREQPNQPGRIFRINNEIAGLPLDLTHNGRLTLDDNLIAELGVIPRGRWVRLKVEVKGRTLIVSYDNGAKSTGPLSLSNPLDSAPLTVRFGISEANSPNIGWIVYWDDLTVREN